MENVIQRNNNAKYDSDESSETPEMENRAHWYSSSSDESDEYTSENDSDEEKYSPKNQNNIKKQFKNLKLMDIEVQKNKTGTPTMEKKTPVTKKKEPEHIKVQSL